MLWFVLFFGLMTLVAGICAISFRNIVHCALFAVAFFFGIACLFFTLRAEFLGAVQIIVYIGAIAILILFAIMLTRDVTGEVASGMIHAGAITGGVVAVAVSASIIISLFRESLLRNGQSLVERTAEAPVVTIKTLGEALMTPYVVPFEVVSILLTAALVGAIVLALEPKKIEGRQVVMILADMATPALGLYLGLSALFFGIGLAGVLMRRNVIIILIGVEMMMNAANLNFLAFWHFNPNPSAVMGQMFTIFGITIAGAEAAVGLALVIAVYRHFKTVNVDKVDVLRG